MRYRILGTCCRLLLSFTIALPAFGQDRVRVSVSGVDKTVEQNIHSHLNLETLPCDISEWRLRNTLSGADEQISEALRALGYYNANWQIDREQVTSSEKPCWGVAIAVTPGVATTIGELNLTLAGEGKNNPLLIRSLSRVPLRTGDQVHHGKYEETKKIIRQAALTQGFFDAHFTESRLEIDRNANRARVNLVFDTGQRYRFGQITLADTPLGQSFIKRYLTFSSGDPFDAEKLIQLQNNLINSQYFDHVSVNQNDPDPADRTVDINVDLAAKRRYESTFGVGYSTDLGPRVSYQLRNRRFNRDGDTYQLSTQFSPVQSQIGLQFQQPGADPVNEKTLWSLGWQRKNNDTYTSDSYNAEVSRIRVADSDWVRTTSLNLLVENFDIASEGDTVVFLYPGVHWQKTRTNNHRYPTRGWRISTGLRGGVNDVLSDTSFFQIDASAKFILPLLDGRLIGRSTLGTTFVEEFDKLPASLRYYAGGDNSVRGFDYESLGPTNAQGEVIGGKYLITGSVEYDHHVYKEYGLAAFYDAGNAFDDDEFRLFESAGLGVRWFSPIGTIRVDLAFPLDRDGFQLHISMGPDL